MKFVANRNIGAHESSIDFARGFYSLRVSGLHMYTKSGRMCFLYSMMVPLNKSQRERMTSLNCYGTVRNIPYHGSIEQVVEIKDGSIEMLWNLYVTYPITAALNKS